MFPKHNFQKYLDDEINIEEYQNGIRPEIIKKALFFDSLNLLGLMYFSVSGVQDGTIKIPLIQELPLLILVYLVIAIIFHYIEYSDTKKNAAFFIKIKEEDQLKKTQTGTVSNDFKSIIPRQVAKLYLADKVSKLYYIKTFFNFQLILLRGFFILAFLISLVIALSITNIVVALIASYLIGISFAWGIKMKLFGMMNMALNATLDQKNIQHDAFENAENKQKTNQ